MPRTIAQGQIILQVSFNLLLLRHPRELIARPLTKPTHCWVALMREERKEIEQTRGEPMCLYCQILSRSVTDEPK